MLRNKKAHITANAKKRLSCAKQKTLMTLAGATATTPLALLTFRALAAVHVSTIASQIFTAVGESAMKLGINVRIIGVMQFVSAEDDETQKSKVKGLIAAGIGAIVVGAGIAAM